MCAFKEKVGEEIRNFGQNIYPRPHIFKNEVPEGKMSEKLSEKKVIRVYLLIFYA